MNLYLLKKFLLLALVCMAVSSCMNRQFELRSGDLLFQVNESNDFTDAITASTADTANFPFSHVGIAKVENGRVNIIEAVPDGGVHKISLQQFLDGSAHTKEGKPVVVVYRLKTEIDLTKAVENAEKYIGLPYDSAFQPDDSSFYCSELIYKSYLDNQNKPIFRSRPMSFSDSTGKISSLWIGYFRKLGKPVPEKAPGTNPFDMSKEKVIREVYRYF